MALASQGKGAAWLAFQTIQASPMMCITAAGLLVGVEVLRAQGAVEAAIRFMGLAVVVGMEPLEQGHQAVQEQTQQVMALAVVVEAVLLMAQAVQAAMAQVASLLLKILEHK